MAHIAILGYVIIVMVGLWAIFHTRQAYKRTQLPLLKYLVYTIVAFNAGVSIYLVAKYAAVNIWEQGFNLSSAVILAPALFVVAFGLTYSLVQVVVRLRDRDDFKAINRAFIVAAILCAAGYAAGFVQFWIQASLEWLKRTSVILVFAVLIVTLGVLLDLVIRRQTALDPNRRKVVRAFGFLLLACFVPYAVAVLLPGFAPYTVAVILPESYDFHVAMLTQLLLNLAPIIWIHSFFNPYYERLSVANNAGVLDILVRDHKISKREREIMELILQGKSNKQIQELLFISLHTVKNHIYNLYQKLNIKSRNQLMSLVMNRNNVGSAERSEVSRQ
jgi:DNA-binding CsgD family transcriptional regulator